MPFTATKVKALGVIFLNKAGSKYYSKYYVKHTLTDFSKSQYDIRTESGQIKLQKSLYQKIKKMNPNNANQPQKTEIFSFSGYTVLFKIINDLLVMVLCEQDQNYVLMENVINCIGNVILMVTTQKYTGKTIEDNLDSMIITVDEVLDQGIIMCLDENQVFSRLKMGQSVEKKDASVKKAAQQQNASAFNSLFGFAKNTLQKTLNFG